MSPIRKCSFAVFSGSFIFLVACLFAATAAIAQEKRNVTIAAPDGIKLKATYYRAAQPGPAVLLLHMCNSNRTAWDTLATDLSRRGIHVLTLDYRGYGESEGGPYASQDEQQRIMAEKWGDDIDAAYRFLTTQPGVDAKRVGAGGGSCGVNQAIHVARRHAEVLSLVLLSGTTDSNGRAFLKEADGLPIFASASEDDGDAVPLLRWVQGFSRNPGNRFVGYRTAGHGTNMLTVERGLPPMIVEWFEKTVLGAPARPRTASTSARAKASPIEEFWDTLEKPGGAAHARALFAEAKRRDPSVFLFPESAVNQLGYERLQAGNAQAAIDIFQLNVDAYPRSANTYDSLADAYVAAGNRERAIEFSEKALQVLRENPPANEQLRDAIRQSAEGKLSQLRGTKP